MTPVPSWLMPIRIADPQPWQKSHHWRKRARSWSFASHRASRLRMAKESRRRNRRRP